MMNLRRKSFPLLVLIGLLLICLPLFSFAEDVQEMTNEKKRTTMSVSEMRKLLGLRKTDSYWLVHKDLFTVTVIDG